MHNQSSTHNHSPIQAQIDDLQSRVAFQEETLQTMSDLVAGQAEELHLARQHIQLLNQKLNELLQGDIKSSSQLDERPPHY